MRGKKQKRTNGRAQKRSQLPKSTPKPQIQLQQVIDMYMALQPDHIGTHMYLVDFPSDIEPSMLLKITQASKVMMRFIFPLLMEIGLHSDGNPWLYPAGRDTAALHINAFAIQSFIDRVLNHQPADNVNPVAMQHLQKGLKLLRHRLDGNDDEVKISDRTISAVLKLASAAQFDGNAEIAQQHMQGLRRIVDLRGGLSAFADNQKLLVEIWRCDLGITLLADSDTTFYCPLDEPVPDFPEQVKSSFGPRIRSLEDLPFEHDLKLGLTEIWMAMRKLCLLVNLGTQTQKLIEPATIYGTMTAVMYRLIRMEFVAGSLDEIVRLGLLAFTNHTFLQWKDIRSSGQGFFLRYQKYIMAHQLEDTTSSSLMLWLLMVGAVSILFVSVEPWLAGSLQRQAEIHGVKSWKDMQQALKMCMWIPLLDEERGKQTYEWLVTSTRRRLETHAEI